MILRAVICLSLLLGYGLQAQNLIPNPSFEDTICHVPGYPENPYDWPFFSPALHWFNPNDATPDYYSVGHDENYECGYLSMFDTDVQNSGEWQYPKDGIRMVGLWSGNDLNVTRELLEAQLLEPLQADTAYCLSMYVSLGNSRNLAIDRMGAFFSMDSVYDHSWAGGFDLPLHVGNPAGEFLTDTAQWMHIEGVYTAQGGERFILIGNAFDDSQTSYLEVDGWGNGYNIAKYYIDDLSLIPCSVLSLTEEQYIAVKVWSVSSDIVGVRAPVGTGWQLYDLRGRSLGTGVTSDAQEELVFRGVPAGIYMFHWVNGQSSGTERLHIHH